MPQRKTPHYLPLPRVCWITDKGRHLTHARCFRTTAAPPNDEGTVHDSLAYDSVARQ
jgi:hypothetical protein